MFTVSSAAEPLVQALKKAGVFTQPTLPRFITLVIGLIVSMGRRTVSHSLVAVEPMLQGHWCNYHRLYSSTKYSLWCLAAVLVRQIVAVLPLDAPIELVADDTVDGKTGDNVWASSAHRDPTRSTHQVTHIRFGHKWLVMCILVQFKGWDRPWAFPIMCGLCIDPKTAKKIKQRQKTAAQIARQILMRLMRWMPDKKFVLTGDYQVVTHQTVAFARRHADRITVVGRLRADANLYAPPKHRNRPEHAGHIKKGKKLPAPGKQIQQLKSTRQKVQWYGNSRRSVSYVTGEALWYDRHDPSAPSIRWVCVRGSRGMDDAYFFCSNPRATAVWIIEHYARRWNIEVTFEEMRALLGLETTRHWCRQSVLRVVPILMGLFSVVALLWNELPPARQRLIRTATPCYRKTHVTFADVLAAVRQDLWQSTLLRHQGKTRCLSLLPPKLQKTLLWHLSAAA